MREISEYKLLGYYLVALNEKTGISSIKYEQVKALTEKVCKRLTTNYSLLSMNSKSNIIKTMISKGLFKVSNINGKTTFSQVYNFEIMKNIFVSYTYDGTLSFKLPPKLSVDSKQFANIKSLYVDNVDLDLKGSINLELNSFINTNLKNLSQTNKLNTFKR